MLYPLLIKVVGRGLVQEQGLRGSLLRFHIDLGGTEFLQIV